MNKRALILIDYINDIVHENGKNPAYAAVIKAKNIVNKCNQVLAKVRELNWLVIWVKVGFAKGYIEVSDNSPLFSKAKSNGALKKGEWGTELLEGLNYKDNELIVFKNRINPFYATNLDLVLRVNHVEELYLAGVATEFAVEATLREAHDRDYKFNVIEDLCACIEEKDHIEAIRFASKLGNVINSSQIINLK